MTTLTQAQRDLLTQVAAEPTGAIAAPDDARLTKSLIKRALILSLPKPEGGSQLIITDAGRVAMGLEPLAVAEASSPDGEAETGAAPPEPKIPAEPKGKLGALIALLTREEGATIETMVTAIGWQAHSVRGAMSGALKKKLGLTIRSEKTEIGRVYRIVEEPAA